MPQTALLRLNGKEGKRTYFVFNPVSAVFRLFYNRFATILPQSLFMRSKLRFLCLGGKGGIRTTYSKLL
jgi:hypothetical protein